jgi:hypothetical protein
MEAWEEYIERDLGWIMPRYRRSGLPVRGALVPLAAHHSVYIPQSAECKFTEMSTSRKIDIQQLENRVSPEWPGGFIDIYELGRRQVCRRIIEDYLGISYSGESSEGLVRFLIEKDATFSPAQFADLMVRSWNGGATGFVWQKGQGDNRQNIVPIVIDQSVYFAIATWTRISGSIKGWFFPIDEDDWQSPYDRGDRVIFRRPK